MSRLPTPNADQGTWGTILNDYLLQSHDSDGTLKDGVVGPDQLQAGAVTAASIAPGSITKTDVGLGNVDNTSDANKPISTATQTALNAKLAISSNLSDLASAATARTNLGLGSAATMSPTQLSVDAALTNAFEAKGRKVLSVYDDFSRYANGALAGNAPLKGITWVTSGANPTQIVDGKATSSGTGYAYQTLAAAPAAVTCEIVWSGSGGGSAMTMSVSDSTSSLNNLAPHFNFGPNGFNVTIRKDGGSFDSLISGIWRVPMAVDGATVYRVSMLLRGGTLVVVGPNGEVFAITDKRLSPLVGNVVFWEPNTSGSTVASLLSVGATTESSSGAFSPLDLAGLIAGAGHHVGTHGNLASRRNTPYEITIGYEPTSGLPGIVFGPTTVYTYLTSAANSGETSIVVQDNLIQGGTIVIESGTNTESATITGNPTGSGPYTVTLTGALTKSHPAGSMVTVTVASNKRTNIYYNAVNGFLHIPNQTYVNGSLYIGSNLDVTLTRSSANVLQVGATASGCVRTGRAATGSRPAAATVGVGSMFYDTTLSKPIWSDGTNWRDAAGTIV